MKKAFLLFFALAFLAASCNVATDNSINRDPSKPLDTNNSQNTNTRVPDNSVKNPPSSATTCPRPADQYGNKFETVTGKFSSVNVSEGGGKSAVVNAQSYQISDLLYNTLKSIPAGTQITLFSYADSSLSGASPPFSCVEIVK